MSLRTHWWIILAGIGWVLLIFLLPGCAPAVPYVVGTAMQAAASSSPFSSYSYHEQYRAQQEQLQMLRDMQQQLMRQQQVAGPVQLAPWAAP